MSLISLEDGLFQGMLEYFDVEALSRLGSVCRSLRVRCALEWERRDTHDVVGRSQADTCQQRVVRFLQGERFARLDEEKHKVFAAEEQCQIIHDERDKRVIGAKDIASCEFFLRVSHRKEGQAVLVWQGFLPVWSHQEFCQSFLSQFDQDCDIYWDIDDEEVETCFHLDLRSITLLIEWAPTVEQLLTHAPIIHDDFADLTFTIVAVSKSPDATNTPVLVIAYRVGQESDDHPVIGFDLHTHHLPGRLVQPELYTNVPRRRMGGENDPPNPRFEVLSIRYQFLSKSDEESFLAGEWNIPEEVDNHFIDDDDVDEAWEDAGEDDDIVIE
jgi:hypothetical protein